LGDNAQIEPFVGESQSDLHDELVKLRDEQLVASNVESNAGGTVTFLLRPETACKDDSPSAVMQPIPSGSGGSASMGGASATGGTTSTLDTDCVKEQTDHPVRVRVSRIACDQGDNIAVEVMRGVQPERLALAELYAERAELEVNLGAFLRSIVSFSSSDVGVVASNGTTVVTSSSPSTRTEKAEFSAAVGVLKGTLTLTGANRASGVVSITQAIDFTTNDEQPQRFRMAAGNNVATIEADGASKTIKVTANLGAVDMRTEFADFISGMFGLDLKSENTAQSPVDMHVAGLRGSLSLDGAKDIVTAEGMDLGGSAATATQNGTTLLSVNATNAQQGSIAASFIGATDDSLGLILPAGLNIDIRYGLEPVMSLIDGPANYLAKDQLRIAAVPATSLRLEAESFDDSDTSVAGGDITVTSSQTGPLFRVETGSVTMSSSLWPNNTVNVAANQCLTRTPQTTANGHDLLDDFVVGACAQ
jgi:hypothetical protein